MVKSEITQNNMEVAINKLFSDKERWVSKVEVERRPTIATISNPVGYCDYHENNVNLYTFEEKGCWNCHYFALDKNYMDVYEASSILGVSQNTIRRWLKTGKIEGQLFTRILYGSGSPKKCIIVRKSIKNIRKERS